MVLLFILLLAFQLSIGRRHVKRSQIMSGRHFSPVPLPKPQRDVLAEIAVSTLRINGVFIILRTRAYLEFSKPRQST